MTGTTVRAAVLLHLRFVEVPATLDEGLARPDRRGVALDPVGTSTGGPSCGEPAFECSRSNVEAMQLGVHYANFTHPDWEHRLTDRLTETARVADQGGVSLFTVMDHWFQMEDLGGPAEPMLEGYTTLGYLAA